MKNKFKIIIWWSFWIIYLELIYKYFILKDLFSINTLSVILFSMSWIILITIMTTIFNERINKILTIILSFIITLITLAQIVYFNFYNSMFSFLSLTTGTGQVMQFYTMIISVIMRIWYIFVIILIPYILFLIFKNRIIDFKRNNYKYIIGYISILIISLLGIVLVINKSDKGFYSLKRLIFKTHAPMLTIDKTGLFTMEMIDLERYIFGFNEEVYIEEDEEKEEEKEEEKIIEYNITNIDFDSLIENESNSKIKTMHEYFSNIDASNKNDYTGLFKGKNLIFITAEAFDTIAIDENITPTLYKMANNSFIFNNYYQPLYPVSTSDGEYMNLISLIPKEGVWSFSKSSEISMPYGIGNMFKKEGYITYGFHNHNYNYYNRQKSHKNIGLTYYGCGNGLEKKMNCKHWPNSDKEMIDGTLNYYINSDSPFMTYYMTVSGHLNYNFNGNNMAYRNKKYVKDLKYSTAIKAYLATQIELDKAMEKLLNELEKSNKLNDTLILIAPDHYPYGLTTKQMNEISKTDRSDKFEKFHTSLIIYNPNIEKTEINKVISSLDILPTIYNLYGLEYDSRLLIGRDIFSDNEHIVILSDRSWITDKGKYNSVTKEFINTTNEEISKDYIDKINIIVNQKYSMSSLILDNNYYKKIGIK